MFRPMQRKKQALSREDCLRLLRQEKRGILSVLGDDGYPYGMPLNHWYCEEDGKLYFRSVIVFGRIEIVEDHDRALAVSRALSYKFTGDEDYIEKEVQFAGHRVLAFALSIEHMSGKLVNEK